MYCRVNKKNITILNTTKEEEHEVVKQVELEKINKERKSITKKTKQAEDNNKSKE